MTPNTEQQLLTMVGEIREDVAKLKVAVLGEDGDGRLPVAEDRLNDHARRLQTLEKQREALPCAMNTELIHSHGKRISRLEWFAALIIGGGFLLVWELHTLIQLAQIALKARQ